MALLCGLEPQFLHVQNGDMTVPQSPWDAETKRHRPGDHKPGGLDSREVHTHNLEAGHPKSGCQQGRAPLQVQGGDWFWSLLPPCGSGSPRLVMGASGFVSKFSFL